jgi:hypothetical protein
MLKSSPNAVSNASRSPVTRRPLFIASAADPAESTAARLTRGAPPTPPKDRLNVAHSTDRCRSGRVGDVCRRGGAQLLWRPRNPPRIPSRFALVRSHASAIDVTDRDCTSSSVSLARGLSRDPGLGCPVALSVAVPVPILEEGPRCLLAVFVEHRLALPVDAEVDRVHPLRRD